MRFNEKEMAGVATKQADKEGRLNHRNLSFREVFKERWFKLKGNLLFYFRLNEYGGVYEAEDPLADFISRRNGNAPGSVQAIQKIPDNPNKSATVGKWLAFFGKQRPQL
ncbi:hypothetical protein IscW_ISCW020662 [Ixodes scapularis]|uniref:PH domain-containing protein n=1 Tax=Ixodes scapularis TaxID=6945 RepID=B7Q2Q5_IXOSC|nr:hypothetical protein IscW_ISCW020662 [Ixodes scapularis]|eukprot:XP_002410935.1 hypothetical protein IscW_ISCW020662 [Ixodes scapularis]